MPELGGENVKDKPFLPTVTLVWSCPLQVSSHFAEMFDFVLKCFNLETKPFSLARVIQTQGLKN